MRFSEFAFDVVTDPAELEAARRERVRRSAAAAPTAPPSVRAEAAPTPAEAAAMPVTGA
jgi:hypothetical protein